MKKQYLFSHFFLFLPFLIWSQTNILSTNPLAEQVILGNYNPTDYQPTNIVEHPNDILAHLQANISPDSLKAYLFALNDFETRNSGSDTLSETRGIGAARRWVHSKFQQFSDQNEGRLIPSYLQFDQEICEMQQHRNVFAVLPGLDDSERSIILIEAHLDSRCAGRCDVDCVARGMEDNGSGTALVIELARVMSQVSFDHTLVFMATTAEEQGLFGAQAFAEYARDKDIEIKAVFNNDIVGGIICGETSSAPSCPGLNHVDSTQVRLFSASGRSKQLSRFIKLEYLEELEEMVAVPMLLTIMSAEDRTGRGGDHIPFRQRGFAAMRFTSANEHGNVDVTNPDYHDRQHTSDDILGVDTDGDNVIDSFFVDFNYLTRNTVINAMSASLAAVGPVTPTFSGTKDSDSLYFEIQDPLEYNHYRLFVRSNGIEFDTIYTLLNQKTLSIPRNGVLFISVASVDENGIESLFSDEEFIFPTVSGVEEIEDEDLPTIELLGNRPNPFDEATILSFVVNENIQYQSAYMLIIDAKGQELKRIPADIKQGLNEILYTHGYNTVGTFIYSLVIDGKVIGSERMIFAN